MRNLLCSFVSLSLFHFSSGEENFLFSTEVMQIVVRKYYFLGYPFFFSQMLITFCTLGGIGRFIFSLFLWYSFIISFNSAITSSFCPASL